MKSENIIERELKIDRISTDAATVITGVRRC
jgi:limonene-1,2-epoxide hydrolase